MLLMVMTGQARRLRSYAARLVSSGLGPRWALSVLGIQAGVVIGALATSLAGRALTATERTDL